MTRQVKLTIEAPGNARLNIRLYDKKQDLKVDLRTGGFEMNDELANFFGGKAGGGSGGENSGVMAMQQHLPDPYTKSLWHLPPRQVLFFIWLWKPG